MGASLLIAPIPGPSPPEGRGCLSLVCCLNWAVDLLFKLSDLIAHNFQAFGPGGQSLAAYLNKLKIFLQAVDSETRNVVLSHSQGERQSGVDSLAQ